MVPEALPVLRVMAELGEPLSPDDLGVLLEGMDAAQVERVLRWADLLGFARPGAVPGQWTLDPVLHQALTNTR